MPRIPPLLTTSILLSSLVPLTTATPTCNGQPAFCDRQYSNITYLGAHDSPFVGPLPQHNQNLAVTAQLDLGIRYLQGQTHTIPTDDAIRLCHTSCVLEDAGTLDSFLGTVRGWLEAHPDEVLTLLLTNGDGVPVSKFDEAFAAAGVKKYAFVPESASGPLPMGEWPTLKEMIGKGKRLVVFLGRWIPALGLGLVKSGWGVIRADLLSRLWCRRQVRSLYPR